MLNVGASVILSTDVKSFWVGYCTTITGLGARVSYGGGYSVVVLKASFTNASVGVLSRTECVDGVDEPFPASSYLRN